MPISVVSIKRIIVAFVAILALLGFAALVLDVLYETLYVDAPSFGSMKVFCHACSGGVWLDSVAIQ